jgi:hypothetical protein
MSHLHRLLAVHHEAGNLSGHSDFKTHALAMAAVLLKEMLPLVRACVIR